MREEESVDHYSNRLFWMLIRSLRSSFSLMNSISIGLYDKISPIDVTYEIMHHWRSNYNHRRVKRASELLLVDATKCNAFASIDSNAVRCDVANVRRRVSTTSIDAMSSNVIASSDGVLSAYFQFFHQYIYYQFDNFIFYCFYTLFISCYIDNNYSSKISSWLFRSNS